MTYTAYTALILTCHHMGIALAFVLALALSSLIFLLFIRGRKHRLLGLLLTFLLCLIMGLFLARKVFEQAPLDLEIVQAG